jgi:hypothetical protein
MVTQKTIGEAYQVNLPSVDAEVVSFSFEATIGGATFQFTFKWLNETWNGWATLPSGEVRQFGCIPNVLNWTGFPDYGVVLVSEKVAIGFGDLIGSTMYVVTWER